MPKQNNYLFQKRNTDNQLETNLESIKPKESVKSKETEKIITTAKRQQNGRHWRKKKWKRLRNKHQ